MREAQLPADEHRAGRELERALVAQLPRGATGLRNSSTTPSRCVATTTALRSLTAAITLPSRSSAMPSTPSSAGCCTNTLSRHSVLAVNVVSQPVGLRTLPAAVELDAPDRAARGVADEQRAVAVEGEPVGHEVLRAERCWRPGGRSA